jgi:murein DD-endopeptidase MepM/ murein hydrolase activator NlpD
MYRLFQCYPFANPAVRLVEGFKAYDGVLKDPIGAPHKGIDYVLKDGEEHRTFNVYAMHDGLAYQGVSTSWGNFVLIYLAPDNGRLYRTVYAHLDSVLGALPQQTARSQSGKDHRNINGFAVTAGTLLGRAGTTGQTNGITQLHLEFHDATAMSPDEKSGLEKIDPYGVYDRASSGRYRQPGVSLAGLDHAWVSDDPAFARDA